MSDWFDQQRAWSKELIPRRTMQLVLRNRQALLAKTTPAEAAFGKMIDDLRYGLSPKGQLALRYMREKVFVITATQWFLVDFYFKSFKLAVEIDGGQHRHHTGRVRDQWRTALLSAHGLTVVRFRNEEVESDPGGEIQRRFLDALFSVPGRMSLKRTIGKSLRHRK